MIRKILVATDGSEQGRKAVHFASEIASKFDATLILMHVLLRGEYSENIRHMAEVEYLEAEGGRAISEAFARVPEGRFPANLMLGEDNMTSPDKVVHAIGEQVLHQSETISREAGVHRVETLLEDGDPARRILEVAEAEHADVVVTGARGLSRIKGLLLGSVSQKVAQLAPITCVTVH